MIMLVLIIDTKVADANSPIWATIKMLFRVKRRMTKVIPADEIGLTDVVCEQFFRGKHRLRHNLIVIVLQLSLLHEECLRRNLINLGAGGLGPLTFLRGLCQK